MRNKLAIILFSISLLAMLIITFKFLHRIVEMRKIHTVKLDDSMKSASSQINVPVLIDGETYTFIVDTGSEISTISESLKTKLDLQLRKREVDILKTNPIDTVIKYVSTEDIVFSLGKKGLTHSFYYSELDDIDSTVDGRIGLDILNKYNWLFDLKNNKIEFSRRKFKYSKKNQLIFHYDSELSKLVYFNLRLDQKYDTDILFDTGINPSVEINSQHYLADLILNNNPQTDSIPNYPHKEDGFHELLDTLDSENNKSLFTFPSLSVNGHEFDDFVSLQNQISTKSDIASK